MAPAHLRAVVAAKQRIQAMIQDAVVAGFLPKQPLETRHNPPRSPRWRRPLAAVIETATSAYLDALDSEDQAMAKLYVQKAAQEASEAAWQQTIER